MANVAEHQRLLDLGSVQLQGDYAAPEAPKGLVLFAHGSGSSRRSARNRAVASQLQRQGFATLLFDLLTETEDQQYTNRFDIDLLTQRLSHVTAWARRDPQGSRLPMAYFGASTGAAAALRAAALPEADVFAVVSRGGRPDLAFGELARVRAPTLLIVGGHDPQVLDLNRQAYAALRCPKRLAIVRGATHLFEEPGALEEVATLAAEWFDHALFLRECSSDRPAPIES